MRITRPLADNLIATKGVEAAIIATQPEERFGGGGRAEESGFEDAAHASSIGSRS